MHRIDDQANEVPAAADEQVRLRDGVRVRIRPIVAADERAMRVALESLSPSSRYRRFMSHKATFTDREVRDLTHVDGVDHVALCAVVEEPGTAPRIVGTARYFRIGDHTRSAESAVMVLDAYQGRGLGTLLFERLTAVATERGIRWFECELLASNLPMKRLLDRTSAREVEVLHDEAGCLTSRVPLPSPSVSQPDESPRPVPLAS